MRRSGPDRFSFSGHWSGRVTLGLVVALVIGWLIAPSAGDAAPVARLARSSPSTRLIAVGDHATLAGLEAQAARLSRQYRGALLGLTGADWDARAATARALVLERKLVVAQRQIARLAAADYITGGPPQQLAAIFSGDPQQVLARAEIVSFLASQRSARERVLQQLLAITHSAEQAAAAKIDKLRLMIVVLERRHRVIEGLLAKFHPQSPIIGDHMTPRMRAVEMAIDQRFGPFPAIGCWRPGTSGEHPLGRACDFMLSTGGVMPTARWIQKGYQIARWAQANAARLGIMYIIYRQRIWDIRMASAGWVLMPNAGSITANHYDHVHISVF